MNQLLCTIPEAAAALRHSRSTIYAKINASELHAVKVGARTYIPYAELERYVAALSAQAADVHHEGDAA